MPRSLLGLLYVSAIVVAALPQPGRAASPAPSTRPCLNVPVSAALVARATCAATADGTDVVAGSAGPGSPDGVVAIAGPRLRRTLEFPQSGRITVSTVGGAVCLVSASGRAALLDPASGSVSRAPAGCGAGGAATLAPGAAHAAAAAPATAAAAAAAPAASMSYYVYPGDISACQAGATSGCSLYNDGAAEPGGTMAVVDFGAPCFSGDGTNATTYGTQVFGQRGCVPISQLLPVANAFARGYASTHGQAITLVVGTSNSLTAAVPGNMLTSAQMQTHANLWATAFVQPLQAQVPAFVTVWAGSDIEEEDSGNYYDWPHTQPWVTGYSQAAGYTATHSPCTGTSRGSMLDYGDDVVGGGGWTAAQIYYAAYGLVTPQLANPPAPAYAECAMPEIYYTANATEWSQLSQQAGAATPLPFTGVMSEGGLGGSLCSTRSWNALATASGQSPPYLTVISGRVGCSVGYGGYSILTAAGGIYSFGDARYYGNLIDHGYPGPAIGLAESPGGTGYAILTTFGGIYTFGDSQYMGNLIDHGYPGPAVAVSATPSGRGYAIVTSFGGIYTFGDARYFGNLIDHGYPGPAVGLAYTPTGNGYEILTRSGAIYSFGDAQYFGNLLDHGYPGPAASLTYSRTGGGYAILNSAGAIYTFGDAWYYGNLLDHGYPGPAVAVSATP